MGWLIGLPLGIFRLLATLLMLAVRFALPVLAIVLLYRWLRRRQGGTTRREGRPSEPDFDGPVYTVDYQEVPEEPADGPDGPIPLGGQAAWLAVRCDDPAAVTAALGRANVRPANWTAGLEAAAAGEGIFVSPTMDGWVLAVGVWDLLTLTGQGEEDGPRDMRLAALVGRFPQGQWFAAHPAALCRWGKFVDGVPVRDYCFARGRVLRDTGDWTGEEIALGFGRFPRMGRESWEDVPSGEDVMNVAAAWGMDPRFEHKAYPPAPGWLCT